MIVTSKQIVNGFTAYSSPNSVAASAAAGGIPLSSSASSSASGRNGAFPPSLHDLPESSLASNNLHFDDDIGPIPPPKMFSDIRLNSITVQVPSDSSADDGAGKENNPSNNNKQIVNGKSLVWAKIAEELATLGFDDDDDAINDDNMNSFDYDEWSSPMVEEIPAKEPQLSAVPKKSAMKKPKFLNGGNNGEPIANG